MPGLCSICCDFRDVSGSILQGWVVDTVPWDRTFNLPGCPHSVCCSEAFTLVRIIPVVPYPPLTHFSHSHVYHSSVSGGNGYRYLHIWLLSALWLFMSIHRTLEFLHCSFQRSRNPPRLLCPSPKSCFFFWLTVF